MKINYSNDRLAEFIRDFSIAYEADSNLIFASNVDLLAFEKFSALSTKYRKELASSFNLGSAEIIHLLLNSDSEFQMIQGILQNFHTINHIDQEEIRRKESELMNSINSTQEDLHTLLNSNSHPGISKLFFEIILLKLQKSPSLESAVDFCNLHNLHRFGLALQHGIPYHNFQLSSNQVKTSKLNLLDYMTINNSELEAPHQDIGNENWILWLKEMFSAAGKTESPERRKLALYLCSDYLEYEKLVSKPIDKLQCILRVFLFNSTSLT